jgi:glycosyltransferase involved in cell wall biosynthesis
MRILEIAPPWFPIPPPGYGGIERVVFDRVEGFDDDGQEVALFAPAGSSTSAQLIPNVEQALGLDVTETEKRRHLCEVGRQGYRLAVRLGADLVHDHTDVAPAVDYPVPVVHTIHGPATPAAVAAYREMSLRGDRLLAISHRQRELFSTAADGEIAFAGVVHNPVDVWGTPFYGHDRKEAYVAFVGRCHWEKDPAAAIRVAREAGRRTPPGVGTRGRRRRRDGIRLRRRGGDGAGTSGGDGARFRGLPRPRRGLLRSVRDRAASRRSVRRCDR